LIFLAFIGNILIFVLLWLNTLLMKKIVFFLFIVIPLVVFSQRQGNIWYFGHHAGLDFSYNPPHVLTNGATYNGTTSAYPIPHSEGTAVICDSAGYLLFYTNGRKIWNRNDQVIPNGDSILGHWSSTQSAIIVPSPGSSRYFYVFTTDAFLEDDLQYGFRYSIVDVCGDNGLGSVVMNNIKLLDTVAEKVTAVKHANGSDYWIITHKYFSDAFYAYHLSWLGIEDTVISHVGSVHPVVVDTGIHATWAAIGQLKASPIGNKLVIVNGNSPTPIAEYFDFNKSTGVVSNCVNIRTDTNFQYFGASFSPDNSKIYIASDLNGQGIYQFDLNAGGGNPDSVRASKIRVSNGHNNYFGLQLAVDGKIYASIYMNNGGHYLSVINNPNFPGLFCDVQDSVINLGSGFCSYSFPNFMDSYDYTNGAYRCDIVSAGTLQEENIKIYPNPANDILYIEGLENNMPVAIYDIDGRWVKSGMIKDDQLDVSSLKQGMYFIKLVAEEGCVVRKFVKE
jgi:hypothetical protein